MQWYVEVWREYRVQLIKLVWLGGIFHKSLWKLLAVARTKTSVHWLQLVLHMRATVVCSHVTVWSMQGTAI